MTSDGPNGHCRGILTSDWLYLHNFECRWPEQRRQLPRCDEVLEDPNPEHGARASPLPLGNFPLENARRKNFIMSRWMKTVNNLAESTEHQETSTRLKDLMQRDLLQHQIPGCWERATF